ncbi:MULTISPECIES: ABC-2 transporter permease [unclassified Paenibacillus]|uniref:ABC-2 transporter permease n=1 Tax=unclassified Paenibacillus TaxID=185978 RepID=UPI00362558CE
MHAFRRLLITDLRNRRNTIIATLSAFVLLHAAIAILTYQLQLPSDAYGFVMVMNITLFSIVLLIPFLHCFSTWREEWKQHSIYHLLSLPVHRTYLLMSKYISIVLEVVLITVVMIAGLWMQYKLSDGMLLRAEPLITFEWSKVVLVLKLLLVLTSVVFLSSLSMFIGKCCGRLSLGATFLSFFCGLLVGVLTFANFPSILTLAILSLAYFLVSMYLLEKKVGV